VLAKAGDDRSVQVADGLVQRPQHAHEGEHGVAAGGGFGATGQAGWRDAQAGEELGGWGPTAVAVSGQEGGHALLAEACGRLRRRIPLQERERDLALDVGEDGLGAGPEGVQGGGELVAGGHALADQLTPGPHHRPQRPGGVRERRERPQLVVAQPQV
jgi:hypothetical protein